MIDPNTCESYAIRILSPHNVGTFWYHAHYHTLTELQVGEGAYGMFLVETDGTVAVTETETETNENMPFALAMEMTTTIVEVPRHLTTFLQKIVKFYCSCIPNTTRQAQSAQHA